MNASGLFNCSTQGMRHQPQMSKSGSKMMRLKCRYRPLHDHFIENGVLVEQDTDVIFVCGDGHQLRAHKVVLATCSKFFAEIFADQTSQISIVSVPDIKMDTMKLILQLAYQDRVFLTMDQIRDLWKHMSDFGMAWFRFRYEAHYGEEQMTSVPQVPVSTKPVELPRGKRTTSLRPNPQASIRRSIAVGIGSPLPSQVKEVKNWKEEETGKRSGNGKEKGYKGPLQTQFDWQKSMFNTGETMEQTEEKDPENSINSWIAKLGKREGSFLCPVSAKRIRTSTEDDQTQSAQELVAVASSCTSNICELCNCKFQTEIGYEWHKVRHVGVKIYKCLFCGVTSKTAKACYTHEKEEHGYNVLDHLGIIRSTALKQKKPLHHQSITNQDPSKPITFPKYNGNQANKNQILLRQKVPSHTEIKPKEKPTPSVNASKNYKSTGRGETEGTKTTPKFPLCALCFAQTPLTNNSQFTSHCTHQHGKQQVMCINCKECFPDPEGLNEPLSAVDHGVMYCPEPPKEPLAVKSPAPSLIPCLDTNHTKASTAGSRKRGPRVRKPDSPIEHKPRYKVKFYAPPKSKRLASRYLDEAKAKTAATVALSSSFLQTSTTSQVTVVKEGDNIRPNSSVSINNSVHQETKPVQQSADIADKGPIPEGMGHSSIHRIEIKDLYSIEAIQQALKCGVCGKEATKPKIIADCLRFHGFYRCSLCFNSYSSKKDYGLHLKRCHGTGLDYLKCPLCRKSYVNAGQTSKHIYSVHWPAILMEHEAKLKENTLESAIQARDEGKSANDNDNDDNQPPDMN